MFAIVVPQPCCFSQQCLDNGYAHLSGSLCSSRSQMSKSFSIYNDLPQAVLVSMQYETEELSRSAAAITWHISSEALESIPKFCKRATGAEKTLFFIEKSLSQRCLWRVHCGLCTLEASSLNMKNPWAQPLKTCCDLFS